MRLHTVRPTGFSVVAHSHTIEVRGATSLPLPVRDLIVTGMFQVRPALCGAGPFVAPTTGAAPEPTPTSCSAGRYSLQPPNLTIDTQTGTSNAGSIQPDPALTAVPSTPAAVDDSSPDSSVLVGLAGGQEDGGPGAITRDLLGPALLNATAVAHAQADFVNPQWIVNVTLTATGAKSWDDVAQSYFHQFLAMDVDGRAVSVPLTQPASSTFVSFGGRLQISGSFTMKSAEQLAADLNSGPLVAPLSS